MALPASPPRARAVPGLPSSSRATLPARTPTVATTLDNLYQRLDACMTTDRRRLRARVRALQVRRVPAGERERAMAQIEEAIARSAERRELRLANLPRPTFPADLPVSQRKDEIAHAIRDHQVVVLCGETGSGKTTQLPKICLELGRGVAGLIGHTQPRRIAARTVGARVAEELGARLGAPGSPVGYKVRFGDQTSPDNYVKLMTDGILLAETQGDRHLEQYDTLIIDEAHERSLNIDFLLGYVRQLLPRRPDLKVIVTSATIDPQRFAEHFAGADGTPAPIIEVSGRVYPVEVRYRPVQRDDEILDDPDEDEPDLQQAILDAVDEVAREPAPEAGGPRDILIFLSGEREIRMTAENLRKHHPPETEILPLFARLSADEQQRVFQPKAGRRRIVLATNVAETSLTVPGIRYVIDPGYARISRYSPRTKVQRLPIEKISQASADQRKGRCGRLSDGVCIRLFSRDDFDERPRFTDPEIRRTNLASVILQMESLRLGHIDRFPFIEPPDPRMVRDGYDTLVELGAVEPDNEQPDVHKPHDGTRLTKTGQTLARLPVDPRIGRMILAAQAEDVLDEVLVIAAALSVQDPRERPIDRQEAADRAHERFRDESSDFIGFLKLWAAYHEQSRALSGSKLRKWCKDGFLSYVRLREWHDVHAQLRELAGELGLKTSGAPRLGMFLARKRTDETPERFAQVQTSAPARGRGEGRAGGAGATSNERDPEAIAAAVHRALLPGLLSNLGVQNDPRNKHEYSGARGNKFHLFPGSALFKKGPKWVVAAELVKTTKLYARTVAAVHPSWIERAAPHLLKRVYSDPHWNERTAQVWAFERVTLFGLELFPKRHIHYGPIDPKISREIFIHNALVEGQYWSNAPYAKHNRELVKHVDELQARLRRRDFMLDLAARFEFFDKRLPANIFSGQAFEAWLRGEQRREPRTLYMSLDDLLVAGAGVSSQTLAEQYPDVLEAGPARLPLVYRFEPGHPEDGVTVVVPLATLGHLTADRIEWLVPGMLVEKVTALIRSLPKDVRRSLVPAPEFGMKAAAAMTFGKGSLLDALAQALGALSGSKIDASQFDAGGLEPHLHMNVRIVDTPAETPGASERDDPSLRSKTRSDSASKDPRADPTPRAQTRPDSASKDPRADPTPRAQTLSDSASQPSPTTFVSPPQPKVMASGRDLKVLQTQYRAAIQASLAAEASSPWNREGVRDWDFGDLPDRVEVLRGGVAFPAYPAVVDPASLPKKPRMPRPTAVWLRLMDRADVARETTRLGLRRLLAIQTRDELKFQVANLHGIDQMLVHAGAIGDTKEFKEDLADLIAELAFLGDGPGEFPRTRARFEQRLDAGWHRLTEAAIKAGRVVGAVLAARHALALRLPDAVAGLDTPMSSPPAWRESLRDVRLQMANLTPPGFVAGTPFEWLSHVPRYIAAVDRRVHKLSSGGAAAAARDAELTHQVSPLWLECLRRAQTMRAEGRTDPGLVEFRWMIEEYRVSLFAQELGTSVPVSGKRLAAKLASLGE
jgi:ATP-dependent helicase HrpA